MYPGGFPEVINSGTATVKVPYLIESTVPIEKNTNPDTPEITAENLEEVGSAEKESPSIQKEVFYVQVAVPVLRVRSGTSTESSKIRNFVKGMVVKVKVAVEKEEEIWYEIQQPSSLRYPERITGPWFIAGKYDGEWLTRKVKDASPQTASQKKSIRISISEQTLLAFEGEKLVLEVLVSTGKKTDKYRTPTGNFRIIRKKLSAYMQGPLPDDDDEEFDLPGIPFVMYFTNEGHALHGTYWHSNFGKPMSHGCVNLPIDKAEWLYWWAKIGTPVMITE